MINKIVMKNVASYKKETVLETDKTVNLIYGLNGTGKSTLSGFLYNTKDVQYSDCKIEGLRATDRCWFIISSLSQTTFMRQRI